MCSPMMIAVAGMMISAAAAGYGAYTQHQNAEAQADAAEKQEWYLQQQWLAEEAANKEAAQSQINQLGIKQTQIADAGAEQLTQAEREARVARARAIVASGEMGVSGNLTKSIVDNLALQHSEEMASIEGNIGGAMQQSQYEKEEAARRGKTVGTGPANIILRPNLTEAMVGAGLSFAGSAMSSYGNYGRSQNTDSTPKTYRT